MGGHRDDGNMYDTDEEPVLDEGNLQELLRFRVDSGDVKLKDQLISAKTNATYISKTTANDSIKCCGEEIGVRKKAQL